MKNWHDVPAIFTIFILLMILLIAGCAARIQTPEPAGPITIKVGLPTPLNDPAAPWGKANLDPYLSWIDLFNREGFRVNDNTYNLQLIAADDQDSPEGGAAAAKQLIVDDGCKFLAGHWSWSYSAISDISNSVGVIFVTRNGGGIEYNPTTQPYNVFGTPAKEEWVADVLALHAKYPDNRIGFLEPATGLTQSEIVSMSREIFDPAGILYHWESYPAGTTDFSPYIHEFAQAGCSIVYLDAELDTTTTFLKQRWDAGYKWPVAQAGGLADLSNYIEACGPDAVQGLIGGYFGIWDFKETKVDPKYIAMCQEVLKTLSQKEGKAYTYNDWIGWLPSHVLMLVQAMQKAGTVDDTGAIMKAIRGGTFSTTAGTFTMSGQKTYGSPIVFGCPCAICIVQGDRAVYLSEHAVSAIP